MSTVVVIRWPVTRMTVTECSSAAAGSAQTPKPIVAATSTGISFRRFICYASPPAYVALSVRHAGATIGFSAPGLRRTLLADFSLCNETTVNPALACAYCSKWPTFMLRTTRKLV